MNKLSPPRTTFTSLFSYSSRMDSAIMSSPVELAGTEDGACDKDQCLDNVLEIRHLKENEEKLDAQIYDLETKLVEQSDSSKRDSLERDSLKREIFNKNQSIEELENNMKRYDQKLEESKTQYDQKLEKHRKRYDEDLCSMTTRHKECQLMLETEKRRRAEEKTNFKVEIENLRELCCSLAGRRLSVEGESMSPNLTCVQPTFGEQEEGQAAVSPIYPYSESPLDEEVHRSLQEELLLAGISDTEWGEQSSPTESNNLAPSCDETFTRNDSTAQGYQAPHRTNTDAQHAFTKAQQPITQDDARMILSDVKLRSNGKGCRSMAAPSLTDDGKVRGEDKNANRKPSPVPTVPNSRGEEPGVAGGAPASCVSPLTTLKSDDQMVSCPTSFTECYPTTPESHRSSSSADKQPSKTRRKRAKWRNSARVPRRALAQPTKLVNVGDRRHRELINRKRKSERHFRACPSTHVKLNALRSYAGGDEAVDIMAIVTADIDQSEDEIGRRFTLKDESRTGAPSVEAIIYESHFSAVPNARIPYLQNRGSSAWCIWDQSGGSVCEHQIQIYKAELEVVHRLLKWWKSQHGVASRP
ncbi:hypothetical protein PMIN04_007917 [Paraphaeosphaeria minitans]|uniref:Uncharacterized protein n=2 Tax=Paraphaeosphaeria minitans TaxID=565426 RepID=A0A9P6KKG0_9PLEO|nr:hypothetical protein PMIN01_11705 [Paraphaeosphaeria minitans]